MAVYGYARVSTKAQAEDGESLAVQQRQIEGYCHMQGLDLNETFVECGVSGSVPVAERPEGGKLWGKLVRGDTVVSPKLDRLFRSALDALQTVEALRARGVHLVLLDLGGDISGNGMARMFLTIVSAFAEFERSRIRERIAQVKEDQKARGMHLGGPPPFGFRIVRVGKEALLEPDTAQQAAILEIHRLKAEGLSLRKIAAAMAEAGHKISHVTVKQVLENGRANVADRPSFSTTARAAP